jgi:hypothetical protein
MLNRKVIIPGLMLLSIIFSYNNATAFSLQLKGGGGGISASDDDIDGEHKLIEGDAYFYEGKTFHLFVGIKSIRYGIENNDPARKNPYSFDANLFGLSIGSKGYFSTKHRGKPYFLFEEILFYGNYDDVSVGPSSSYSAKIAANDPFFSSRIGLGFDYSISSKLSLGIEVSGTALVNQGDLEIKNSSDGSSYNSRVDDVVLLGIGITLRYFL